MDRSDIVNLYSDSVSYDEYGVARKTRTAKEVFCKVDSVTRAEFFEAGRSGLNPEYRITMFFGDYNGESVVGYKGRTYSVYRTYQAKTDIIELYVERKGGTNGEENTN
jgi:SPP1 family predicted phage head-tail adaptor